MHVTACTSFSIVTSTEGMPIAATEIEFLRVTNTLESVRRRCASPLRPALRSAQIRLRAGSGQNERAD